MPAKSLIVAVDRIEGKTVVLEGDDGRRFEIPGRELREAPSEGVIYSVPLDKSGAPRWEQAIVDQAETDRRRKHLKSRMDSLRNRDTGGDIEL